ncbi:venom carboxylesterase-6-like isoform X1 [Daphnia pulicaria]|uniref:venom carboxylesterase-6-like isoform X1 n=2 Tax=Daphnia pulicaria TaxID=35523 RepID=UPI001EEAF052|nr:venom carboxylesterase-6-like isoform X1 [Daphnia pulicaria]
MNLMELLCLLNICNLTERSPMVEIPSLGQLRGSKMVSSSGRNYYAFRGIPYAKPPVGNLRFRDPEPADPWVGKVLDASRDEPTCIQYNGIIRIFLGEEDCLTLNVYTHNFKSISSPSPVMVYIHPGSWFFGSGNGKTDLAGPGYFLDRNVVYVTMKYRLGAFGFLSTEDSEAPGNYGLLDQTMALRWIRDNIRHFGGDPNLVTIFGCSAGAASVHYHLLSPHSKGLFHRAIAQSGSTLNPWARKRSVGTYTKKLAQYVNCPQSNSSALLACLRQKPANQIVRFQKEIEIMHVCPVGFGPRVDVERESPFLPAEPRKLMETNQINSVPMIAGSTRNEGGSMVRRLVSDDRKLLNEFNKDPLKYFRFMMGIEDQSFFGDKIIKQIAYRYFTIDRPYHPNQLDKVGEIIADYLYYHDIDESVDLLSKNSNHSVYYYLYNYNSHIYWSRNIRRVSSNDLLASSLDLSGTHSEELYLMFSHILLPRLRSAKDIKVSNMLLDLWTSFAKDGVPRSDLVPGDWIPTKEDQPRYLRIEADNPSLVNESMPFRERLQFWRKKFIEK